MHERHDILDLSFVMVPVRDAMHMGDVGPLQPTALMLASWRVHDGDALLDFCGKTVYEESFEGSHEAHPGVGTVHPDDDAGSNFAAVRSRDSGCER